jgi:hypothetical protein
MKAKLAHVHVLMNRQADRYTEIYKYVYIFSYLSVCLSISTCACSRWGIMSKGGLGHHYGGSEGCGYENLSLTIIEQVKEKNLKFLAERELYWQHQLRVYIENG